MAAPDWLSYVAAGAGVAGAIMGFVSMRRTSKVKALDLRLELRKQDVDYENGVTSLLGLIPYAKNSRCAVDAALGRAGSGGSAQWVAITDDDFVKINAEFIALPKSPVDYSRCEHTELESMLIEMHRRLSRINDLREKYRASLVAGETDRERILNQAYIVRPT